MMEHSKADHEARVYVNGLRKFKSSDPTHEMTGKWIIASGEWSPRFRDHALVKMAEAEDWGRMLRAHCIHVVKRQMMGDAPYDDIDKIMPDKGWIAHQRIQAERYRLAEKWRQDCVESHGDVRSYLKANRPQGFATPRHGPVTLGSILARMTGDRE